MKEVYIKEICHDIKEDVYHFLCKKKIAEETRKNCEINRWASYTRLLIKWNHLRLYNKNIAEYMKNNGYKIISIYGCGDVGKLCCDELLISEEVEIIEFVDRAAEGEYKKIPIVKPENINSRVDAIIITPIVSYLEIAEVICQYTKAKLISLEDIVNIVNENVHEN